MATAVAVSQAAETLEQFLERVSDGWSASGAVDKCFKSQKTLRQVDECFKSLTRAEKLRCLLCFAHARGMHLLRFAEIMQRVIDTAVIDPDQWVQGLARLLNGFPAAGHLQCAQVDNEFVYRLTEALTAAAAGAGDKLEAPFLEYTEFITGRPGAGSQRPSISDFVLDCKADRPLQAIHRAMQEQMQHAGVSAAARRSPPMPSPSPSPSATPVRQPAPAVHRPNSYRPDASSVRVPLNPISKPRVSTSQRGRPLERDTEQSHRPRRAEVRLEPEPMPPATPLIRMATPALAQSPSPDPLASPTPSPALPEPGALPVPRGPPSARAPPGAQAELPGSPGHRDPERLESRQKREAARPGRRAAELVTDFLQAPAEVPSKKPRR